MQAPPGRLSLPRVLLAGALGCCLLTAVGLRYPAPPVSGDYLYLLAAVTSGASDLTRWHLLVWTYSRLVTWLGPYAGPEVVIRCGNAFLATLALLMLAGCARRLGRTRGEAAAITLLAWTAFGTLQLAIGYLDVYPVALAATAAYLWTALGAIDGDLHPLWPVLIAVVSPFCYVGLVLLLPSLAIVVAATLRRPRSWAQLATAAGVAVAAAGAATIPVFGRPFAWGAFVRGVAASSAAEFGPSPSSLLPVPIMLSRGHAAEVAHTLLLVDGVGVLLLAVTGTCLAIRAWRGAWDLRALLLVAIILPYLAYAVAMEPVYGPFGDWDLFSYGAAATSLLGAWAFVVWGRNCRRTFAVLLGAALAAAGVHLLARLNALDVDVLHHRLAESPAAGGARELQATLRCFPLPPDQVRVALSIDRPQGVHDLTGRLEIAHSGDVEDLGGFERGHWRGDQIVFAASARWQRRGPVTFRASAWGTDDQGVHRMVTERSCTLDPGPGPRAP
jgi:hypothetical protein